MKILGIETSCDETAIAILNSDKDGNLEILSNVISSSLEIHAKTGGIIPENAAREQLKIIIPVLKETLDKAGLSHTDIDAIAVTIGPGLIASLLVGVETAKTLSYIWNIHLIPVNHLYGHIYANFITDAKKISFPAIALVVSGGHTDLVLMKDDKDIKWLGGTRDDAAGEALDKIGRLLNLPYPAGPTIETLALKGDSKRFVFPRPMIGSKDFDFSFSGLKAAVLREIQSIKKMDDQTINDICACTQKAIIQTLVRKTLKASKKYNAKSIILGGGVSANQKLRDEFKLATDIEIFAPPKFLCTDNGAMIAAAAFYKSDKASWKNVDANPELYF